MRYLLFILTAMLLAAPAPAQKNIPEGPSPLVIDVYKEETNTVAQAETNATKGLPQGPSTLVVGTYGETASNAASKTGIAAPGVASQGTAPLVTDAYEGTTNTAAAPTDRIKAARVSFLMDTGVQYANEGEYKEAEQAYLRALLADPGNADLFFRLSTLYIQMERYEDSAFLLEKLVAAFPDNPMLHNNLSWVYSGGGKMKNGKLALRHAHEAILLAPYAPALWNTLAEAYYVSADYDKALRASSFALDLLRSQQNVNPEEIRSFETQRSKIQRAAESYKRLLGIDTGK